MTNESVDYPMPSAKDAMPAKYDLEERTARFGETAVGFAKNIPKNSRTAPRFRRHNQKKQEYNIHASNSAGPPNAAFGH